MLIPASDSVLVDTSAWIHYFRGNEPFCSKVGQLLDADRICTTGIIIAELLQGAKSKKERHSLRSFPSVFPVIGDGASLWIDAGDLSARLREQGLTIGLADCFIAVVALKNQIPVLTEDRHFAELQRQTGLTLIRQND